MTEDAHATRRGPSLDRLVRALRRSGVVGCPTEWNVMLLVGTADPDAIAAVSRLGAAEQCCVLLPDVHAASSLAETVPVAARVLAAQHWPGPLSIVFRNGAKWLERAQLAPDGKITLRVPGPSPALELVRALGRPLLAFAPREASETVRAVEELPEWIRGSLDGAMDGIAGGTPLTEVDVTGPAPVLVRAGAIQVNLDGNRQDSTKKL